MGLHGKHVDLGRQKGSSFVSVTSAIWTYNSIMGCGQRGQLHIYALTDAGWTLTYNWYMKFSWLEFLDYGQFSPIVFILIFRSFMPYRLCAVGEKFS